MRIHVRDSQTRQFLRGDDTWAAGNQAARIFPSSMEAFRHCIDQGYAGVDIVIDFGPGREPLIVPVDLHRQLPQQSVGLTR